MTKKKDPALGAFRDQIRVVNRTRIVHDDEALGDTKVVREVLSDEPCVKM